MSVPLFSTPHIPLLTERLSFLSFLSFYIFSKSFFSPYLLLAWSPHILSFRYTIKYLEILISIKTFIKAHFGSFFSNTIKPHLFLFNNVSYYSFILPRVWTFYTFLSFNLTSHKHFVFPFYSLSVFVFFTFAVVLVGCIEAVGRWADGSSFVTFSSNFLSLSSLSPSPAFLADKPVSLCVIQILKAKYLPLLSVNSVFRVLFLFFYFIFYVYSP